MKGDKCIESECNDLFIVIIIISFFKLANENNLKPNMLLMLRSQI